MGIFVPCIKRCMKRITVDISDSTNEYFEEVKRTKGVSISFQANALIELAIKERNRKTRKRKDAKQNVPVQTHTAVGD